MSTDKVMNTTPSGLRDTNDGPTEAELAVLRDVLEALRNLDFGSVELTVQDRRVVQLVVTRKKRL